MLRLRGFPASYVVSVCLNGRKPKSATSSVTGPGPANCSENTPSSPVDDVSVTPPAWAVITAPGRGFPPDITFPVRSEAARSDTIKQAASKIRYSGKTRYLQSFGYDDLTAAAITLRVAMDRKNGPTALCGERCARFRKPQFGYLLRLNSVICWQKFSGAA